MDLPSIIVVALGLSMDCLAVATSASISSQSLSLAPAVRLSLAFGISQAAMLSIGWYLGQTVVDIIEAYDHWIAFALLLVVGGRMLWEAIHEEERSRRTDISKGLALFSVSIATSLDSLGVGLGLAFLGSEIVRSALVVGSVAFSVTAAAFYAGRVVAGSFGRWAEIAGGLVLIAIGLRILLTDIL